MMPLRKIPLFETAFCVLKFQILSGKAQPDWHTQSEASRCNQMLYFVLPVWEK